MGHDSHHGSVHGAVFGLLANHSANLQLLPHFGWVLCRLEKLGQLISAS